MADFDRKSTVSVSCPKLMGNYLNSELESLGFRVLRSRPTGCDIFASLNDCIRLNLKLRTAHRVHFLLGEKPINTPENLYEWLNNIPWEEYIPANGYFSVTSRVDHPTIKNTQFANLKCKDAIVDRMREKTGKRPDSGSDLNRTVVFLFWNRQSARIFLDTSGESLSRRGYRAENTEAPMQESLASAILMASGLATGHHLINPMCGSGTIAIEAAMWALGREPGSRRRNYGFMHINGFERETYKNERLELRKNWKKETGIRIIATDHDPNAVNAARENAKIAGVDSAIEFSVCDFTDTPIPEGDGYVILNPPYGQRLGEIKGLEELYTEIGSFFKKSCAGKTGYVFTGNPDLSKKIGLKPFSKTPFYNSTIECRLLGFELYEGKRDG